MESKRLVEELHDLESDIEVIQSATKSIQETLKRILSAQNKSIEIIFSGERFDFNTPCTKEELEEQEQQKDRLVYLVLRECFNDMIADVNSWDYVRLFASGIDPLDMQLEKIDLMDLYNVTDSNGNPVKSLPLNEEAYQVKQELEYDSEIQDLDTI